MLNKKTTFPLRLLGTSLLSQLILAEPALAIQSHGPPEGIYVHLIGHVLFGLAMLGFALRIRVSHLQARKSWRLMARGALLLALWNVWAFIAHILATRIPASDFIADQRGISMWVALHNPIDVLYYIFKMDHILCVPAIVCIYMSLRRMNNNVPISIGEDENLIKDSEPGHNR